MAGNQTVRAGGILRSLDLPANMIGTSDDWDTSKPALFFFERVADAAPCKAAEILYVGHRLDNDIRPAVKAGMATALIRRGPWGVIQHGDPETAIVTLHIDSLLELPEAVARLNAAEVAEAVPTAAER